MKRNFLKISLFLIGVFTCLSCEASTLHSSSSSEGVGESIPTAQQWNKDVVGWNLGNAFECSAPGQMVSRCRLATLMVLSMQRQLGQSRCYQEGDTSREEGRFQCHPYSNPLAVPHYQRSGDEHRQGLDCSHQGGGGLVP